MSLWHEAEHSVNFLHRAVAAAHDEEKDELKEERIKGVPTGAGVSNFNKTGTSDEHGKPSP